MTILNMKIIFHRKKRVYQNVKSSFSNLHFVTFYMNKAVSELKNYS